MTVAFSALIVLVIAHRLRPRVAPRRGANHGGGGRDGGRGSGFAMRVRSMYRHGRRRRAGITPAAVAEWCGDLARATRSGATLRYALEHVVPADAELVRATDRMRLGLARGRPIADVADAELVGTRIAADARRGAGHLALAGSVIAVCGRIGAPAAAPLDRVAATLRQRTADAHERAAQAAQARLSAHVLTVLPIGVLAVLVSVDDGVRSALASPPGFASVLAGTVLNAAGSLWMRRIIRPARGSVAA